MRHFLILYPLAILAAISILGIPGQTFTRPPLWVFPDMDIQARYKPQGENTFFEDRRNARPLPPATVARGDAWQHAQVFTPDYTYAPAANPPLYSGKDANGDWQQGFPLTVSRELLRQGQEKYTIFCAVCHGATGDGKGITYNDGSAILEGKGYMSATANLLDERLRVMSEGEIFNTITHGKNLMGAYGAQLLPEERWAVIAYLRALQRARHASAEDLPENEKARLGL